MELNYDNLTGVSLIDLYWAYNNGYERDVKWLALNVVSILSDDTRERENKSDFRKIMGRRMYRNQNLNWSTGSYEDVVELVTKIATARRYDKYSTAYQINQLTHQEYKEISIRIRRFSNCSYHHFGQSSSLKMDDIGRYYMWDYDSMGKLTQVPEQLLKENLILWDNKDVLMRG